MALDIKKIPHVHLAHLPHSEEAKHANPFGKIPSLSITEGMFSDTNTLNSMLIDTTLEHW